MKNRLSSYVRILHVLFAIVILVNSAIPAEGAKKTRKLYVMAVGVGKYKDPCIQSLRMPTSDADSIAALFRAEGAEVLVLKDEDATGDSIRSKMRVFFSQSTPADNVLFFFSGHGVTSGFCGHDINVKRSGCLTFNDIKEIFQGIDAYGRMIMADACHSGDLRTKPQPEEKIPEEVTPIVAAPSSSKNKQQVMLFLSSRGYEYSYENSLMPNGYFTYYLCEALKGAADENKNGVITAKELNDYVSFNVRETSTGLQHPVMWGNFSKGWIISHVHENK